MPKRKKVVIKARELQDVSVSAISLVKRGANRVPFRIIKSQGDSDMKFDLTSLFLRKDEEVAPQVVGVAIAPDADLDIHKSAMENNGFTVESVIDDEDTGGKVLLFVKSDDFNGDDVGVFKVNDHSAVVVADLHKGLQAYPDSVSFMENMQKTGFYPSYRMALDTLNDTLGNILYSEGDAEVTKSSVEEALNDFSKYVMTVLDAVPDQLFKAESALVSLEKGMLLNPTNEDADSDGDGSGDGTAKDSDSGADSDGGDDSGDDSGSDSSKDGDGDAKDSKGGDSAADGGDDGDADDGDAGKVKKSDQAVDPEEAMRAVMAPMVTELTKTMQEMSSAMGGSLEKLNERLTSLEADLKKAEEAIAGTALASDTGDDDATVEARKSQGDDLWDGALNFGDGVEIA